LASFIYFYLSLLHTVLSIGALNPLENAERLFASENSQHSQNVEVKIKEDFLKLNP